MKLIFPILITIAFVSCKKEDADTSTAPEIEFISMSSTEVDEFENAVVITFKYEDPEGDIGEPDPDAYSLRLKDARLNDFDWYHIPPLTPDLQELHVRGNLSVQLNPLFLLGNGSSETTHFTLQIKDRDGNWSNQIQSPEVTINEVP
jgi:hypothetical protein